MTAEEQAAQESEENGPLPTNDINKDLTLYDPIKKGLAELKEKYKAAPPADLSIPENYETCRLAVSELKGIRGKTEKLRKDLKAGALEYGRKVDATAKEITETIKGLEEPYAKAKKDYDTKIEIEKREKAMAEERRVDGIYERIATINNLATKFISAPAAEIEVLFPKLNESLATVEEWAMEFADKAKVAIVEAKEKLTELHTMKVQSERMAAEQAQAQAERERQEEADRIKREQEAEEERKRLEAEREALEKERAALQAERDRVAAEQAEREKEARAEQERLAAEQTEKDRIAEEERKRLEEELAALKQKQEQANQPAPEPEQEEVEQSAPENPVNTEPSGGQAQQQEVCYPVEITAVKRNEAGKALITLIGNKERTIRVLDAISNNQIPHIRFV